MALLPERSLLGVIHTPKHLPFVIAKLDKLRISGKLTSSPTLGLEVTNDELVFLRSWNPDSPEGRLKATLFFYDVFRRVCNSPPELKRRFIELEQTGQVLQYLQELPLDHFHFWRGVIHFADEFKIPLTALDYKPARDRSLKQKLLADAGLVRHHKYDLQDFLTWPIREKHMVAQIAKLNPGTVVVGNSHVKELAIQLRAKGIPVKIVLRQRVIRALPAHLLAHTTRSDYAKRKALQKRVRGRKGLIRAVPK